MNAAAKRCSQLGLIIVLLLPVVTSAQRNRTRNKSPQPERQRSEDRKSGTERKTRTSDRSPRQRAGRVRNLQGMMKDELGLSRAQSASIDGLFREHLRTAMEGRSRSRSAEDNRDGRENLESIRDQIVEARRNGDTEKAAELRQEFRNAMETAPNAADAETEAFLSKLEAELTDEQVDAFRGMRERAGLDENSKRGQRGGGLLSLRRAVMSPKIGLSSEQREAIQRIMQGAMASFSPGDRESGRTAGAMKQVRTDILAQLTPEQRVKVEAALKADRGSRGGGNRSREGDADGGRRLAGNRDRSKNAQSPATDEPEVDAADSEPVDDEPADDDP